MAHIDGLAFLKLVNGADLLAQVLFDDENKDHIVVTFPLRLIIVNGEDEQQAFGCIPYLIIPELGEQGYSIMRDQILLGTGELPDYIHGYYDGLMQREVRQKIEREKRRRDDEIRARTAQNVSDGVQSDEKASSRRGKLAPKGDPTKKETVEGAGVPVKKYKKVIN